MEYLSPRDGGLLKTSPRRVRSEWVLVALFLVVTLALIYFCSKRAYASPIPIVRVMVEREKSAVRINGFDLVAKAADTDARLGSTSGRGSITVRCSLGGKLAVDIGHKKMRLSGPLNVSSMGGFIRVGGSQYRDDLYVYSFNGDCIVVNHVDIEKYVAGLLNSEMSARWNVQALMAQAVAARTYAIHQMKEASTTKFRGLKPPFDVEGTVRDQVYEGAHQERYSAIKAVQATRGQVLSYKGEPIKAFYHSTCGGRTESPEKVWGSRLPYMKPVECGNCNKSPRFNWVYDIRTADIEKKLRDQRLLKGSLVAMRVIDRNRLGRANRIEVEGTLGKTTVGATRIRDLMGTLNIRSTDFSVVNNGSKYVFVGHGSGHGVGMCQWGAKGMADRGRDYRAILKHYYPIAELTRLY